MDILDYQDWSRKMAEYRGHIYELFSLKDFLRNSDTATQKAFEGYVKGRERIHQTEFVKLASVVKRAALNDDRLDVFLEMLKITAG